MGRKKKIVEEKPKEKKYRCTIEKQWKDFNSQDEARDMLKKVLETNEIFFCSLRSVDKN